MNDRAELTPNEARQGRKAPMVRRVLFLSGLAAIVLLAIIAVVTMNPT